MGGWTNSRKRVSWSPCRASSRGYRRPLVGQAVDALGAPDHGHVRGIIRRHTGEDLGVHLGARDDQVVDLHVRVLGHEGAGDALDHRLEGTRPGRPVGDGGLPCAAAWSAPAGHPRSRAAGGRPGPPSPSSPPAGASPGAGSGPRGRRPGGAPLPLHPCRPSLQWCLRATPGRGTTPAADDRAQGIDTAPVQKSCRYTPIDRRGQSQAVSAVDRIRAGLRRSARRGEPRAGSARGAPRGGPRRPSDRRGRSGNRAPVAAPAGRL